jgi:regulator of protease activity HflC (stomatin/prohibitin superfamily)
MQVEKTREVPTTAASGFPMLLLVIGLFVVAVVLIVQGARKEIADAWALAAVGLIAANVLLIPGFFTVPPNTARVLLLFGKYVGTVREGGFHWTNPFYTKRSVSLRAHTLNGEKLKVNDKTGNPIEIAAVVVWRVQDTAQAVFDVEDYAQFVQIQSETAVRHLASTHPYDGGTDEEPSLRGSGEKVAAELQTELQSRLAMAGVDVVEARLAHLAYAPEIAGAMLRRQQAAAVIAARTKIVEGAVGMVEMALQHLSKHQVVQLDEERKAAMVSNLLVVLCSEQAAQPVVNSGTLYS